MVTFHPQRLYPRFASTLDYASRSRLLTRPTIHLLSPWVFSDDTSTSENPTQLELADSVAAVCAFPRTGSTFLQAALEAYLAKPGGVWKSHDALALERYHEAQLDIVCPIREPSTTVESWSVYNSDPPSRTLLRERLHTYIAWHRIVSHFDNKGDLIFVDFDSFTKDPLAALSKTKLVQQGFGDLESMDKRRTLEARTPQEQFDPNQQHLPSNERESQKAIYRELLAEKSMRTLLDRARSLVHGLISGNG